MISEETELLTGKSIHETLKSDDGRVLVVLNIAYPACAEQKPPRSRLLSGKRKKSVPLQETLDPFYERAASEFAAFARGELLEKAKANPNGTPPCGAVLRWKIAAETDDTLTVHLDGSVFDGRDAYPIPPDVRTWDKKTGQLHEKDA